MFNLKKKILGLDFGHRSLKGVLLAKKGNEIFLEHYFYYDLRETFGDKLEESQFPELLSAMVDGAGLKNCLVASALEDKEVQIVNLNLPALEESELRTAVLNELEVKLGDEAKDIVMDYVVAQPGESTRAIRGDIPVSAHHVKRDIVTAQLQLLEQAKLRPHSLESSMQAAVEALRFNDYISGSGSFVVVDVGEVHTSVGLVVQGELQYLNVIRSGSGDINRSLMTEFKWTYKDSELLKLSYKMGKEENANQTTEAKLIEQGYYQIILGIHDTVAYFRAARKDQVLQSVVMIGGGCLKSGLSTLVEQSLNLQVVHANSLKNIQIFQGKTAQDQERLPHLGSLLHVAVGLALRGVA